MSYGLRLLDWQRRPLLTAQQSGELDRRAAQQGIEPESLMAAAGAAVARRIALNDKPDEPVLVLCGPGNNGGDGWIVASELKAMGWPVRVASLVPPERLKDAAASARQRWDGPVETLDAGRIGTPTVIVDALFGVGLNRLIEGRAASIVDAVNQYRGQRKAVLVYAIDISSGIDADTGAILGTAIAATHTVSFVTAKPGHLLYPGRACRGHLEVVDIGITADLVAGLSPKLFPNDPALWQVLLPERTPESHKYTFGHALICGGPITSTGATRLAAEAALRVGAGLVSVATDREALPVFACTLTSVMTKLASTPEALRALLSDRRLNAVLLGPGAGISEVTAAKLAVVLERKGSVVLDADALTMLAREPALMAQLQANIVLTPHEGEFSRLFPKLIGPRIERAKQAAQKSAATIVLKGSDTIVAAPDGRIAVMAYAPPSLATAGTGDVLAGLVTGILAQKVPSFEAACAAVWLHAEGAALQQGGIIAEDLPRLVAIARGHLCVGSSRSPKVVLPIH